MDVHCKGPDGHALQSPLTGVRHNANQCAPNQKNAALPTSAAISRYWNACAGKRSAETHVLASAPKCTSINPPVTGVARRSRLLQPLTTHQPRRPSKPPLTGVAGKAGSYNRSPLTVDHSPTQEA